MRRMIVAIRRIEVIPANDVVSLISERYAQEINLVLACNKISMLVAIMFESEDRM